MAKSYTKKRKTEKSYKSKPMARNKKRKGYSTVPRSRGIYGYGEMKYFETERNASTVTAPNDWTGTEFPPNVGTPTTIFCPAQGPAIDQRIGRDCTVYKIKVRGLIIQPNAEDLSATKNPQWVRVALVEDTQTNAAQAQGEQIFNDPVTATPTQAILAFQALTNTGRFNVLKDKTYNLSNANVASDFDAGQGALQGLGRRFSFNIVYKKGRKVRFNATNGGTIADIVDNSWCIYAMSTQGNITIQYTARVSFKE